jgi:hypothetical protein
MYILCLSQKMRNIYKLKLSESIPDEKENQFPLMNWYVKPEIINRKKYILFLERQNYLIIWAEGVTGKNIGEIFRANLIKVLETAGIPQDKINSLKTHEREIYFSKTSDRVWIGVSTDVARCIQGSLYRLHTNPPELKFLITYSSNNLIYGGPNYKNPEDEIRKMFGLKPRSVDEWNLNLHGLRKSSL